MAPPPHKLNGQAILSEDDCLHHRGPMAHPGRLSLTSDLLVFSPSRALDRLAGAEDLIIPTGEITELSAGGINHNLDVYLEDQVHRFSGRGAIRVHARILALLAEDDAVDVEDLAFEPGERVLLQGQAELFVNQLIAVRGEITLTDRRLRFFPGLGIEQLIWNTTRLEAPIDQITAWSLKGMRRRLHATMNGDEVVIGGALTPQLFNVLESLYGDATNAQSADEVVLETWEAQLRRGPVAHPGHLEFTPTHVRFQPTGLLDAIIGVKPIQFLITEITRISVRGWPEKKLIIRAGHEVYGFTLANTLERLEELRSLIRDRNYQLAMRPTGPHVPRYQVALDSWTAHVDYNLGDQIVFASFAMEARSETEIRFGWLLLLRTRVLFLPLGGPASQEQHVAIPLEQICRLDGGPRSRRDQILLSAEEGRFRFLLSEKEGAVEEFWAQCRSPTRILAWETLGPRSTSRVMGKSRFIRIMSHGETVVDLSPGMTVEHPSGVAIVLPGEPGGSVPLDTWVTVEIGQSEGIYQIDSKVVRAVPTPLEGVIANAEGTHMLIVSTPPEIRVYNQRESYRVLTQFELRANSLAQTADGGSWMATGETYPCTVVDLSIGGCALDTDYELADGDRISLNLPLLDQWVEIRATCVRRAPIISSEGSARYGLEFRELSMAQEDILHKSVMTLQREALADPEEEEESEEESAK
jgi:hypothetical protein